MPTVWFGKGLFAFLHHVQKKCRRGRATAKCVCWQGAHRHFSACSKSCITEGTVQHLQELSTSFWLTKKEGRDARFVPVPRAFGLHSFIVLHRAFLPCSLTCSVTNYSLIAGWQKKSFTALRLFLTNQVTEALKIILSRKAPWGFLGCLGCVKLY